VHKCPHCGEKTITTFKKLMPGWSPRCPECGGKWRLSYFPIFFIMLMPFAVVPILLFFAFNGMGVKTPAAVAITLGCVAIFLLYAYPLVKK
jgi:hypothetical protein